MNNALVLLSEGGSVIDRLQGLGDAKKQLADPDYWSSVGIIALTGILVVFLILAILIFIFWLMGTIFKVMGKSKKEKKSAAEAEKAVAAPVTAPEPAEEEDYADDEELVAVISAAIAAYTEESFTVKSIRKRGSRSTSAWRTAGISQNTRPF